MPKPDPDRDLPRRYVAETPLPDRRGGGIDMKRCFSNVGGVRIVDVRTVLLTGPCTHDPWLSVFKQSRSAAFVEIETDTGIVGLGETYAGYFFPESVPLVVDYLRPILIAVDGVDRDDFDLRVVVARMRTCFQYWGRVGLGAAVLAGIEGALWDLVGKVRGLPVHRLLAPEAFDAPDSLPAYATGGPSPWPTDDLLRKVEFYLELGFRAVKLSSGYLDSATRDEVPTNGVQAAVETEVGKATLVRDTFGADVGLLLDGHMGHREGPQRWDVETAAAVLHALEVFGLTFFEEPLRYDDLAGYAELTRSTTIPVAGGEQLSTVGEFAAFADRDAFAVAQPDAAWLGIDGFVQVARRFGAQRTPGRSARVVRRRRGDAERPRRLRGPEHAHRRDPPGGRAAAYRAVGRLAATGGRPGPATRRPRTRRRADRRDQERLPLPAGSRGVLQRSRQGDEELTCRTTSSSASRAPTSTWTASAMPCPARR